MVLCDNDLFVVSLSLPVTSDGVQVSAVKADVGFHQATSIAAAQLAGTLNVFISRSDGNLLCIVEKLTIDVNQTDGERMVLNREVRSTAMYSWI